MTNMAMVKYALDKGYIPVIDMQTEKNTYLDEEQVGKKECVGVLLLNSHAVIP